GAMVSACARLPAAPAPAMASWAATITSTTLTNYRLARNVGAIRCAARTVLAIPADARAGAPPAEHRQTRVASDHRPPGRTAWLPPRARGNCCCRSRAAEHRTPILRTGLKSRPKPAQAWANSVFSELERCASSGWHVYFRFGAALGRPRAVE